MENGLIAVDRWVAGSQAYFLTHLHSDHTVGLSSSWVQGPLFCSRLTAKLFPFKFSGFQLSLLRLLDLGSWHSLYLTSPSSALKTLVEVMAIDAHHCPGAVMYLFRGEFGCILYTGDFRWEATCKRAKMSKIMLFNALEGNVVNTIFLDNTYCNPSFSFPSREIVACRVVDIIVSHPEHDIIIGIGSLGKEELLLHISRALKTKIWVWPERLQTLHLLGFHDMFTTKTSLTRVRAVPRYSFSIETLKGLNSVRPTLGIIPSGMPWVVDPTERIEKFHNTVESPSGDSMRNDTNIKNGKSDYAEKFHQYIYSVPYSDHSCFSEIQEFVKLIRPMHMKGIVSSSFCYVDPSYYMGHYCGGNQISEESNGKSEKRERVRTKSMFSSGGSNKLRKRDGKGREFDYIGDRVSRVSLLRRKRCGVKIAEDDG